MASVRARCFAAVVGAVLAGTTAIAQSGPAAGDEARVAAQVESLRHDPGALRALLQRMPKGGDLHMHLSGAVYAETFIQNAVADNLCVDTVKLAFTRNTGMTKSLPPQPVCADGTVSAATALKDQKLYDELVDSFSMRAFVPSAGVSGHDQFFATFARFGGTAKSHLGEWLDEVAKRASAQHEQYLEIMNTPDFSHAFALSRTMHWDGDAAKMRDALLAGGLRDDIATDRAELDAMEATRQSIEHCGTPQAVAACYVKIRYLYQVLRSADPERVFAQTLLGYELASVEPRILGINFVQPEDTYLSMTQYSTQMGMLAYLKTAYPKVHLSLHAGELAPGMVPPEGLRFHIREAVERAGAERIGHGVDVMGEDDALRLLREMAEKHVSVEVNLTSNDGILGIKGAEHPLHNYMRAGVPFSLSTDDEGVSRIDLTHEYVRAVIEQGLTYKQLKQSARASLEHSFLPGDSLWARPDDFTTMRGPCAGNLRRSQPAACTAWLKSSEKGEQEWELERGFVFFEIAEGKGATR